MKRSLFHYYCPQELIAQEPAQRRDGSRLLVFNKDKITDSVFTQLPTILNDIFSLKDKRLLLIGNNSKVYPARLRVFRKTGAKCEIFMLEIGEKESYSCLIKPKSKLKQNEILYLDAHGQHAVFELVDFENSKIKPLFKESLSEFLEKHGQTPLPPYIKRTDENGSVSNDKSRYQNVYAHKANLGSSAAPTAGFHFSNEILQELPKFNIDIEYITLHVGLGTFLPVKTEEITEHHMHEENYNISQTTIEKIFLHLQNDWPIVFIGTTSLRSVESFFRKIVDPAVKTREPRGPCSRGKVSLHPSDPLSSRGLTAGSSPEYLPVALAQADKWHSTNLFLYPVDEHSRQLPIIGNGILTNFHQPESSLTMLVASLIGFQNFKKIYNHALEHQYRFFSYGDSSLLIF